MLSYGSFCQLAGSKYHCHQHFVSSVLDIICINISFYNILHAQFVSLSLDFSERAVCTDYILHVPLPVQ